MFECIQQIKGFGEVGPSIIILFIWKILKFLRFLLNEILYFLIKAKKQILVFYIFITLSINQFCFFNFLNLLLIIQFIIL